ncbi:Glycosyltransferase [Halomicronema hongdechloris C2206]|uniref:Glycosyltransferase n=2 Tax=Halomicronema hongdechloris TaxID=1209493 RepID=A0A1Z3HKH1_9CYAN|nr:Glycosyltransferase [Halomicronema hongdechloris C2206]
MKSVVQITSVHSLFDTRIFQKECKSLTSFGYRVILIVRHAKDENIDGISIEALSIPRNRLQRMIFTTFQVYRRVLEANSRLHHFHDPELVLIGLLLKLQSKTVIYDVHEDVPRQILSKHYIPKVWRATIAWIVERLETFSARRFDAVVAATPHITHRFESLGCHAVNINNYPILNELHTPRLDWSQKERVVCYVGGIAQIRGIQEMVDAIGQTDVKLLLAGQFADSQQRQRVVSLPGWANVQELGQLDRPAVAQTLARAQAGLVLFHPLPNHIDAQPNKMFEYMSAGLPVIASDFPLWREIIEGNDCGICVDPLDVSAIREAIEYLINHPDQAQRLGQNGLRAIETTYNWETEAQKLKSLYEELLA